MHHTIFGHLEHALLVEHLQRLQREGGPLLIIDERPVTPPAGTVVLVTSDTFIPDIPPPVFNAIRATKRGPARPSRPPVVWKQGRRR